VTKTDLSDVYRDYIACLNKQDWPKLGQFVDDEVIHNGRRVGLSGYLEMLERDFDEIPDLHFNTQLLISDPPYIASRLGFDCTPRGAFLGLQVTGNRPSMVGDRQGGYRSSALARRTDEPTGRANARPMINSASSAVTDDEEAGYAGACHRAAP
jgi:predicted ester cyclase